jgi:hypothetical protein
MRRPGVRTPLPPPAFATSSASCEGCHAVGNPSFTRIAEADIAFPLQDYGLACPDSLAKADGSPALVDFRLRGAFRVTRRRDRTAVSGCLNAAFCAGLRIDGDIRASGEIGRHARFRILCLTACGFESRLAHQPSLEADSNIAPLAYHDCAQRAGIS